LFIRKKKEMVNNLQPNRPLEKKLNILAVIVSIAVLALVGLMRRPEFKIQTEIDFSFLPPFHSTLNALAAIALIAALYFIKNKNMIAHRNSIYAALVLSAMFLLSYVVYHFTSDAVIYGDANFDGVVDEAEKAVVGSTRTIYLILLITHVTLAGVILPFILLTFNRAFTNQFDRHKKIARYVYPLWLYVAITGPVCYLMLRPFYPG
jgi:putative membrane protein